MKIRRNIDSLVDYTMELEKKVEQIVVDDCRYELIKDDTTSDSFELIFATEAGRILEITCEEDGDLYELELHAYNLKETFSKKEDLARQLISALAEDKDEKFGLSTHLIFDAIKYLIENGEHQFTETYYYWWKILQISDYQSIYDAMIELNNDELNLIKGRVTKRVVLTVEIDYECNEDDEDAEDIVVEEVVNNSGGYNSYNGIEITDVEIFYQN